jgi:hypothetical protein
MMKANAAGRNFRFLFACLLAKSETSVTDETYETQIFNYLKTQKLRANHFSQKNAFRAFCPFLPHWRGSKKRS